MNTIKNTEQLKKSTRSKGRPKNFCREEALKQALGVFCEKGYEAASIALLGEAMNMKPPSLYNAFGDKERLFLEVLEHYHQPYEDALVAVFAEKTDVVSAVRNLMDLTMRFHGGENAKGCLVVNSSINVNAKNSPISCKIKEIHDRNEALISGRLKRGQEEGDIREDVDVVALGRFLNGMLQGVSVLARGQQSPDAVRDLIVQSLEAFVILIDPR